MTDIDLENGPFVRTDFIVDSIAQEYITRGDAAKLANARLKEILEGCETVYCYGKYGDGLILLSNKRGTQDTHTAKLIMIKEIKK